MENGILASFETLFDIVFLDEIENTVNRKMQWPVVCALLNSIEIALNIVNSSKVYVNKSPDLRRNATMYMFKYPYCVMRLSFFYT